MNIVIFSPMTSEEAYENHRQTLALFENAYLSNQEIHVEVRPKNPPFPPAEAACQVGQFDE